MLRRWKEGRKKIVMLWYPYHTEKRGTEGICDPASVEGVPEEYHAPLLGTLHACAERITAETSLPALLNTLLLLPSHWPDNESAAAAAGSATGEAIWRALALLFTTGIVVHDGLQKPAASIAALAALAALATCDGSCARDGVAVLQKAALDAARWGVCDPHGRRACVELLATRAPRDAPSSWQCLVRQLFEHGLAPPPVLPAYCGMQFAVQCPGEFLPDRGDKYDVSCTKMKIPACRLRSLFHDTYVGCISVGARQMELTARVNTADRDDFCLNVAPRMRRDRKTTIKRSRNEHDRDVYFLVTPYGQTQFPDLRLQTLLRTPPPEWEGHRFVDSSDYTTNKRDARTSTLAGRLPGCADSAELAELVELPELCMVWVFAAVGV